VRPFHVIGSGLAQAGGGFVQMLFALERLAGGARIIDVALDSGYASQSAFTAMFRRHFGMPPGLFHR
jgi:AraC-like DNA-binding protein